MGVEDSIGHPLHSSASSAGQPAKRRRRSAEVDLLRARALADDPLSELSDTDREWVWRSLLKEVRLTRAAQLAGLVTQTGMVDQEQVHLALQRVRERYHHRLRAYHDRSGPRSVSATASAPSMAPAAMAPASMVVHQADVLWPLPAAVPSADVSHATDGRFAVSQEGGGGAEMTKEHRWWPFTRH